MRSWKGVKGGKYYLVQFMDEFWVFYNQLKQQKVVVADVETNGLSFVKHHACGLAISWGVENNYYLPFAHEESVLNSGAITQLDLEQIRQPLAEYFARTDLTLYFWNENFDRHMLNKAGIQANGLRHDGVTMTHLLDENREKKLKVMSKEYISPHADKWEKAVEEFRVAESQARRKAFNVLVKDYAESNKEYLTSLLPAGLELQVKPAQFKAKLKLTAQNCLKDHWLAKNKKDDISYAQVPIDILAPYACADGHYTFLLNKELILKIAEHDDLRKLYMNEVLLADVLYRTELNGVKVNVPYLKEIAPVLESEVAALTKEVYEEVGYEFDIESPVQLAEALIKKGIKLTKLTKGGKKAKESGQDLELKHYSTDNDTLEFLAATHVFVSKIQDIRKKSKRLSTYVLRNLELVDENHYIHSTYNANVSTGRLSSKNPNLTNVESRDLTIKRSFTVPELVGEEGSGNSDYYYICADQSQVELRLTAHHSQDPMLLDAYCSSVPKDVHSMTCAEVVLSRPLSEIEAILADPNHPEYSDIKWFRNIAKRVNFLIVYGGGGATLQRQVSTPDRFVSVDDCNNYINSYFVRYQGVNKWIKRVTFELLRNGFVKNTFGRYRNLPDSQDPRRWVRDRAARQGVNFLVQGDAADIFKTSIVRLDQFFKKNNAKTRLINFVHDSVDFYWHKGEMHLLPEAKRLMEDFPQFTVPLSVDFQMSPYNWADCKHFDVMQYAK